jgi:hypothetical protein
MSSVVQDPTSATINLSIWGGIAFLFCATIWKCIALRRVASSPVHVPTDIHSRKTAASRMILLLNAIQLSPLIIRAIQGCPPGESSHAKFTPFLTEARDSPGVIFAIRVVNGVVNVPSCPCFQSALRLLPLRVAACSRFPIGGPLTQADCFRIAGKPSGTRGILGHVQRQLRDQISLRIAMIVFMESA